MAQYLNKFAGTVNRRQSDQIFKLLNRQRNSGQIRSVQEFQKKLDSLMRELTSTSLQPLLRLWSADKAQDIDSETFNFMLDRVEDDLYAAFEEANNIDEVQKSHEAIIRDVVLKNLRSAVAELDSKVTLFEFLNKDLRGFDSAIFSTFKETKEERTTRDTVRSDLFFKDPRKLNESISESQDAEIELVGERLTLALIDSTFHAIGDVRQIFDSEAPQSVVMVESPDNNLLNIIDNTKGTFWVQSILFNKSQPYTKSKLEFDFGLVKEINVIEIELASRQGLFLESIFYLDGNNTVVDLGIEEQFVDSIASIKTTKFATNKVILVFRNESPYKAIFEYDPETDSVALQALKRSEVDNNIPSSTSNEFDTVGPNLIKNAMKDLDELISSTKVKEALNISTPETQTFTGYGFTTGVDNVRFGLGEYEDRSIYISAPLDVTNIGEVGLKTLETRPYLEKTTNLIRITESTYDIDQTSLTTDESLSSGQQSNVWFQSSIEYWVTRLDFNSDGSTNRRTVFPILPLDVDRIYHERLVLYEKSDVSLEDNDLCSTMFFTTDSDGDIKVYRNGVLTTENTDWENISTTSDRTPNTLSPMSFNIKILDQLPGDIFTVTYTPVLSSTTSVPKTLNEFDEIGGLKIVDLVGDLTARANQGQIIALDRAEVTEGGSKIYLTVLLRQNASNSSLTPAVEEYTLVAGKKDSTKFEEL